MTPTWSSLLQRKANLLRELSVELEVRTRDVIMSGDASNGDTFLEIEETAQAAAAIAGTMERIVHRERIRRDGLADRLAGKPRNPFLAKAAT